MMVRVAEFQKPEEEHRKPETNLGYFKVTGIKGAVFHAEGTTLSFANDMI